MSSYPARQLRFMELMRRLVSFTAPKRPKISKEVFLLFVFLFLCFTEKSLKQSMHVAHLRSPSATLVQYGNPSREGLRSQSIHHVERSWVRLAAGSDTDDFYRLNYSERKPRYITVLYACECTIYGGSWWSDNVQNMLRFILGCDQIQLRLWVAMVNRVRRL